MTDATTPENPNFVSTTGVVESPKGGPEGDLVDLSEWGPPPTPVVPPEMGDAPNFRPDVTSLQFDHTSAKKITLCSILGERDERTYVRVPVKYLPHYEGLPEMELATPGSSAVDLYAAIDGDIFLNTAENRVVTIPCGFCMELPSMVEAQIRPRSGLARKGIVAHFGTIDSDYRGEVQVILFNHSTTRFKIERGMRIAQMVISGNVFVPNLFSVKEINSTERGSGGFGSTGLK